MATTPVIALAGPTGDFGGRIANALVKRGANVRALVPPASNAKRYGGSRS